MYLKLVVEIDDMAIAVLHFLLVVLTFAVWHFEPVLQLAMPRLVNNYRVINCSWELRACPQLISIPRQLSFLDAEKASAQWLTAMRRS